MKNLVLTFKKYHFLLYQLVKKDIQLKYRNSYLGVLWTLLEPLLTMMVLVLVFSKLYHNTKDFPVYILTGRLLYSFFSATTRSALKSVRANAGMIKKVYVPKYMYPCAGVLSGYIQFLISLIVLAVVAAVCGIYPTWHLLEAVFPLVIVFIMTMGAGLWLSTLAVFFRDLEYLWGVALMLLMYACAIFYKVETVIGENNRWLFRLNPLYAVIENFRDAVYGNAMNVPVMLYSLGFSIVLLVSGIVVFYKNQDKFILHL
ncbi:MAG: ABC transporter permease [Lachnospiraceae bacterium]|nr:ABC transporter permease [Lachnospiraceae bacterium]MBP3611242.1 ABC transporter permease [Lachnospiraceae bacterium]